MSAPAVIMNQLVCVRVFPDALLAHATYLNAAEQGVWPGAATTESSLPGARQVPGRRGVLIGRAAARLRRAPRELIEIASVAPPMPSEVARSSIPQ